MKTITQKRYTNVDYINKKTSKISLEGFGVLVSFLNKASNIKKDNRRKFILALNAIPYKYHNARKLKIFDAKLIRSLTGLSLKEVDRLVTIMNRKCESVGAYDMIKKSKDVYYINNKLWESFLGRYTKEEVEYKLMDMDSTMLLLDSYIRGKIDNSVRLLDGFVWSGVMGAYNRGEISHNQLVQLRLNKELSSYEFKGIEFSGVWLSFSKLVKFGYNRKEVKELLLSNYGYNHITAKMFSESDYNHGYFNNRGRYTDDKKLVDVDLGIYVYDKLSEEDDDKLAKTLSLELYKKCKIDEDIKKVKEESLARNDIFIDYELRSRKGLGARMNNKLETREGYVGKGLKLHGTGEYSKFIRKQNEAIENRFVGELKAKKAKRAKSLGNKLDGVRVDIFKSFMDSVKKSDVVKTVRNRAFSFQLGKTIKRLADGDLLDHLKFMAVKQRTEKHLVTDLSNAGVYLTDSEMTAFRDEWKYKLSRVSVGKYKEARGTIRNVLAYLYNRVIGDNFHANGYKVNYKVKRSVYTMLSYLEYRVKNVNANEFNKIKPASNEKLLNEFKKAVNDVWCSDTLVKSVIGFVKTL